MALIGGLVAPLGVLLAGVLPRTVLTLVFSIVMVIVAVRMLVNARHTQAPRAKTLSALGRRVPCRIDPATGQLRWTAACALTVGVIGAIAGLCSGLLGLGGGFVLVPALTRFSDIEAHQIIATSLLAIALIAVSSVASALIKGAVVDHIGVVFMVGCAAGMVAGRAAIGALPAHLLLRGFALLMLVVAVMLGAKALALI
jgi:uncharacterized membrane protein YfcA